MVRLTITPAILRALEELQDRGQLPEAEGESSEPLLKEPAIGNPVTHGQIIAISKTLKDIKANSVNSNVGHTVPYHLDDLLRGSKVYVEPPKPKAEPTSEYKALMARLRREEEDRAYERMINPPLPLETFSQRFPNSPHAAALFPSAQADIGEDDEVSYADINRQMALIINILVSIVACSVAIWLAARHWSTPSRLGLSMGGSGMVGVAEVVVYAGYLRRVKEARRKGKTDVEVKEIIKTFVIGGTDEKGDESIPVSARTLKDDQLRRRKGSSR